MSRLPAIQGVGPTKKYAAEIRCELIKSIQKKLDEYHWIAATVPSDASCVRYVKNYYRTACALKKLKTETDWNFFVYDIGWVSPIEAVDKITVNMWYDHDETIQSYKLIKRFVGKAQALLNEIDQTKSPRKHVALKKAMDLAPTMTTAWWLGRAYTSFEDLAKELA